VGGASHFVLPPGDTSFGPRLLMLEGARGFTLSGAADGSSTLWFAPGGGVVVANSSNCTVAQLTIDYGGPAGHAAVAQFAIRSVVASVSSCCPVVGAGGFDPCAANEPTPCCNATYELELHPDSLPIEGWDANVTTGWPGLRDCRRTRSQIFNNGSKPSPPEGWLHTQCHASRPPRGFVPIRGERGEGGGQMYTANQQPMHNASVGTRVVFYGREYLTYVVANSSGVLTRDVTIHSATGFAIVELDGECGHVYRRVRLIRRPGDDPLLIASNADGFHSSDCAKGPLIEDSELSNMMDDYMNIHSSLFTATAVDNKLNNGTLWQVRLQMARPRFFVGGRSADGCGQQWSATARDLYDGGSNPMQNVRVGDTLSCHRRDAATGFDGGQWARLAVQHIEVYQQANNASLLPTAWLLTAKPINATEETLGADLTKAPGISCWIERFSTTGAIVRNNHLHDGLPGAGIRWKSSGGRIENNIFERSASTHIEIAPYSDIEGPLTIANVSVVNNVWKESTSWSHVDPREAWQPPCQVATTGVSGLVCGNSTESTAQGSVVPDAQMRTRELRQFASHQRAGALPIRMKADDDGDSVALNYLCKNWTEAWPTCTPPASHYADNQLLKVFPIGAWWDPTPDEYEAYANANFKWVLGFKPSSGQAEVTWESFVAGLKHAKSLGLMMGAPTLNVSAAAEGGADEVIRLPGKCVGKASRDTNGPVSQDVQFSTGCYLSTADVARLRGTRDLAAVRHTLAKIKSLPDELRQSVVSMFLSDDMSDWEENHLEMARAVLQGGGGSILPYVNDVRAEGVPEALTRVPTPLMANEVYGTRDLGKPQWAATHKPQAGGRPQAFLTDVDAAQLAQVQLYEILGANQHRFGLHSWPLFNVGTGGCGEPDPATGLITCGIGATVGKDHGAASPAANKVVGKSLARFAMFSALSYGAKGFIW
jgi:hypothetical protein